MGDTKAFTTLFNLNDNFTAKFDAIQKRINAITNSVHKIDFNIGNALLDQTKGVSEAATKAGKASGDAMAKTSDGAKKAAGEVEKSTSALDKMQTKMSGVTGFADKLKEKFGAITATLTGGTIAGMAWIKAMDSQSISDSIYRKLERKHVDTKRLQEFVAGANIDIGSGGDRLKIADTLLSRTKMKGPKLESFVQDTEKFYAMNSTDLARHGIGSSADLADLLSKKNLSKSEKQFLKDYGLSTGSVGSRARSLTKANEGATEEDIIKANPLDVFNRRLGDFSSKMGKTLVEPMLKVLAVANKIIDAINSIPGAPNLVAMGLVLVSASGAASLLATALAPLATVYSVLQKRMIAHAAVTQVATVEEMMLTGATEAEAMAAVQSGAATNLSWSAKLRLAAANIYASVATKAHSIATMANNAISWASAGAMAALATIYGVLTGSISLTTIATWALNAAMTVLNALNPFTYIIAGAAILAGIVGIIAYKSGFLGTIWKDLTKIKFGKIFDDLMKGDFSGAWKKLSKGMGTVWSDMKIGASLLPTEISETITGKLTELVRWVTTSFPFLSKIHEVIKKVHSIFEWIYSLWQGFWSWIKSAIPGAAKESKRKEMEKQAKREGLGITASGSIVELDTKGNPTAIGATGKASQKLLGLQTEYKNLPGFAEGIAEAVAKGMASIGDTIATKIKDALEGVFPDLTPLTDALTGLYEAISNWNPLNWDSSGGPFSGASGGSYVDYTYSQPGKVDQSYRYYPNEDKVVSLDYSALGISESDEVSWDNLPKDAQNYFNKEGHAKGATFTRSGLFQGNVHAPEEIIPQAIAAKGPGPIARALDAFYGATVDRRETSTSAASRAVEVHIHSSNDFSGMRVSSAIDIEKLMRDIDRKITSGSVEAVKNAIGQGRT